MTKGGKMIKHNGPGLFQPEERAALWLRQEAMARQIRRTDPENARRYS